MYPLPDVRIFRRQLACIVVQVLSSHSARYVSPGAFLTSVSLLTEVLVLLLMLCPPTAFPVKQVTGAALLIAARSNFLESFRCILPMYRFADGHRKKCVSFRSRKNGLCGMEISSIYLTYS